MDVQLPPDAACRNCGYLLRGLSQNTCPECATEFDPAQPTTYRTGDQHRRRVRRWIWRGIAAAAMIGLGIAVFPRELAKGTAKMTCQVCGYQTTVNRWEPRPPKWVHIRYPGFCTTSEGFVGPTSQPTGTCRRHALDVAVQAQFGVGACTGSGHATADEDVFINGQAATPATAEAVLKSLMSPTNMGISIGSGPKSKE